MLINDCFDLFVFRSDCAVSKSGRRLLTCGFLPTVLSQRVHVGCLPMVSCRLCCLTKWTSAVYLWFRAVFAVSQSGRRLFTCGFVPSVLSHKVDVGCLPVVSCRLCCLTKWTSAVYLWFRANCCLKKWTSAVYLWFCADCCLKNVRGC